MIKLTKNRNIGRKKKVLIMIFLFSFIFMGIAPVSPGNMQITEKIGENLLISPLTAEVHSEISIIGDTALDDFCDGNGTDGLSWATAYVIKDYEIDAGASGSAIEISDTTLYLIIQNCTVTNSGEELDDAGIYLSNCTNIKIIGCNSSDNYNGIYLDDSNDCIINGNNASDNSESGISLMVNSIDNTILENNASNNYVGIYLGENSDKNTILMNNVSDNDYGIELYENCDNNTVSGNIANYNSEDGIYLYDNSDNNTILGNMLSYNGEDGIELSINCDNNIISGNNITDNGYGIYLSSCVNTTISGNNIIDNLARGISLSDCHNNTISGNNVSYNENYGINLLSDSDNNVISGNDISNNSWEGILIETGSDNNTISGNNASYNEDGIGITNSENNTISGNNLSYNDNGIYLSSCVNTTISGNNASYNDYGIYLSSTGDDNTIWMNYISNNSISQGYSDSSSNWDNGTLGNYWGDFVERYPDATSSNGIWWDWDYQVESTIYNDTRPLVHLGFPEIESSGNVNYMIDDEGNEISWTISDSTILDPTYWIYLDGVEIQNGLWSSGGIISIDVDDLTVGTYNYLLKCNDGTAWGWSESQIVVSVVEIPKPVIITTSQTISTENITVEWSEVVGVDSYNVYINGTLTYSTDTLTQNIWLNESGTYSITVTAINGAEESEHSDAIVIVIDIKSNVGIIIGSIGGSLVVVGVGAFLFIRKRRTPT